MPKIYMVKLLLKFGNWDEQIYNINVSTTNFIIGCVKAYDVFVHTNFFIRDGVDIENITEDDTFSH